MAVGDTHLPRFRRALPRPVIEAAGAADLVLTSATSPMDSSSICSTLLERRNGTWLLNPGSPTDRRQEAAFSYLEIEVADGRLTPKIIRFGGRAPAAR